MTIVETNHALHINVCDRLCRSHLIIFLLCKCMSETYAGYINHPPFTLVIIYLVEHAKLQFSRSCSYYFDNNNY